MNDKLVHVGLYTVFGATLAHGSWRSAAAHWPVILLGIAYGGTDELHQALVPGRDPSWADWGADSIGVLMGYTLAWWGHASLVGTPANEDTG